MLRLTIDDPVPGTTYSLQDSKSTPVNAVVAVDAPLSFDVPVRVMSPGSKLAGDFIRREGPVRRFIYLAMGGQAGDQASEWSRRAKIDVHDIPAELLAYTFTGKALECRLPGRAADGGPSCGTVRPMGVWTIAS